MKKQTKFNEFDVSTTYDFVRVALELGYSIQSIKDELNDSCSDFTKKLENLRTNGTISYSMEYAKKVNIDELLDDILSKGRQQNRYTNSKVKRILEKYISYIN